MLGVPKNEEKVRICLLVLWKGFFEGGAGAQSNRKNTGFSIILEMSTLFLILAWHLNFLHFF